VAHLSVRDGGFEAEPLVGCRGPMGGDTALEPGFCCGERGSSSSSIAPGSPPRCMCESGIASECAMIDDEGTWGTD